MARAPLTRVCPDGIIDVDFLEARFVARALAWFVVRPSGCFGFGATIPAELLTLPSAGTPIRYVVLHHTGIPDPHFDLMLQIPDAALLPTWRIKESPENWPPAAAERIKDHRPLYLTFEGKLSENRGTVQRVAAGPAIVVANIPPTLHLQLEGDVNVRLSLPL